MCPWKWGGSSTLLIHAIPTPPPGTGPQVGRLILCPSPPLAPGAKPSKGAFPAVGEPSGGRSLSYLLFLDLLILSKGLP